MNLFEAERERNRTLEIQVAALQQEAGLADNTGTANVKGNGRTSNKQMPSNLIV